MLAGAAVVVAICVTLSSILSPAWAVALLAVHAWFAVPGIVLARRLYAPEDRQQLVRRAPGGPGLGLRLEQRGAARAVGRGCTQLQWLLLAPLAAAIVVWPARRLVGPLTFPVFTRRDVAAAALVLLAVTAIVGRPYSQVGRLLPEGRAYRAYFTADFVSNMSIVAEVSKGDLPPQNPYYRSDPLHYYWLMHLLPSAEYQARGPRDFDRAGAPGDGALDGPGVRGVSLLVCPALRRQSVGRRGGVPVRVLCSSFEGAHRSSGTGTADARSKA